MQGVEYRPPGVEQLHGGFANMNLNPQPGRGTVARPYSSDPQHIPGQLRAAPVNVSIPHLEQWLFTKWKGGHGKPLWLISERCRDPVDHADLQAILRKQKAKSITSEQQLNAPDMKGNKRLQAIQLIDDRNASDPDPCFDWIIRNIRLERDRSAKDQTKAMQIIIERKPCRVPRHQGQGIKPCSFKQVISVGGNTKGTPYSPRPYGDTQSASASNQIPTHPAIASNLMYHPRVPLQQAAPPPQQLPGMQSNGAAHTAVLQAQQRRAAPGQQHPLHPGHPPDRTEHASEDRPSSSSKRAPDMIRLSSDEDKSTSEADDSLSDRSDTGTAITTPSYGSRASFDRDEGPRTADRRRQSKSSNSKWPKGTSRRHGVTVRQHRRPSMHEESSSDVESQLSAGEAEIQFHKSASGRRHDVHDGERSHRPRKQHKTLQIRQHERPGDRERPTTKNKHHYAAERCEIQPAKGSGTRRNASYHAEHAALSGRRRSSHISHASGGPTEKEYGDRYRQDRSSTDDDDDPVYRGTKARGSREWEKRAHARKPHHAVNDRKLDYGRRENYKSAGYA